MTGANHPLAGLRVVWDSPIPDPDERRQVEAALTRVLIESLVEAAASTWTQRNPAPPGGLPPGP
jgi:hypothetical protein